MIVIFKIQFVNKKKYCVLCIIIDGTHGEQQSVNGKFYIDEKRYMYFKT